MNIYLLTQRVNKGYDTYDSMVVCAKDEEEARNIHPEEEWSHNKRSPKPDHWAGGMGTWASRPDQVSVILLGEAKPGSTRGIECASFNAG